MCKQTVVMVSRFDPRLCPLLCGLPAEEQEQRMRDDPRIRACIEAIEGRGATTPSVSKMVHAYEHCAAVACASGPDGTGDLACAG